MKRTILWWWIVWMMAIIMTNSSAWARTELFVSTDVPKTIPDQGRAFSGVEVGEMEPYLVEVELTVWIEHTYVSDLLGYLVSPSGTIVTLFSRVGGPGDDFVETRFSDAAEVYIGDGTPSFEGVYRPEGSLGNFIGENPNGVWRLRLEDTQPADEGQLLGWDLKIIAGDVVAREELTLSESSYSVHGLDISGLQVAWREVITGGGMVIVFDGKTGGRVELVGDPTFNESPSIDGRRVAWEGTYWEPETDGEIMVQDLRTAERVRVTENETEDVSPQVSGRYVVWGHEDDPNDWDIYVFDWDTGQTWGLTDDGDINGWPLIEGPYVAWEHYKLPFVSSDLMVYDFTTGQTVNVTQHGPGEQVLGYDLHGRYAAYVAWVSGIQTLFLYDILTGALVQVAAGVGSPGPYMAGRYVAYSIHDGNDWEVRLYDIEAQQVIAVTENDTFDAVRDAGPGMMVWEIFVGGDDNLVLYDIGQRAVVYVTAEGDDDGNPAVGGGTMAWRRGDDYVSYFDTKYLRTIVCTGQMPGDANRDCKVDLFDFALMASDWLNCHRWPEITCE
ncbi:MAG: proprotein convertase P-domain-containing protein [Sedimentisphaerales bacterium]|nr:proprotein convertase P-domain-containing protein [Sedimentisphaerales bacterium]